MEEPTTSRIKHFLWLVKRQRLLTNSERTRRCLTDNPGCILCGDTQETVLHVLRDYRIAKEVWMKLLSFTTVNSFFVAGFEG